jgi:RNA polymerase sigma factor (sigma-70 family)
MLRKQPKIRDTDPTTIDGPFTPEEERSLAAAVASGDTAARERMIMECMDLAARIAHRWRGRGLDEEDLLSEATCGLIRAVDQFDPSRGIGFRTYASYCIRQSLSSAVEVSGGLIVLPAHTWKLVRLWKRGARALTTALGRTPTSEEIAESLGFSHYHVHIVAMAMTVSVKLASTIAGEGSTLSPLEKSTIEESRWTEPSESLERRVLRQRFKRLNRRESLVLTLRYGLNDNLPHSIDELVGVLGVSRHTIRMIVLRAEQKLRAGPNPRLRRR